MSDAPDTLAIVWRYIDDSTTQNDTQRQDIERSDDYYLGRLPHPPTEVSGRSSSVSMDVQSMCVATSASVIEGLTAAQPARFKSQGDQDDMQAGLESLAVTDAIMADDGYLALIGAIESSCRYSNAVMRGFVEKSTVTEKRTLPDATAEQLAQVAAQIPEEMDPVIKGETVSWQRDTQKLIVETIETSRYRFPKDHPEMNPQGMPFQAIEHRDLRKDLIEMGFDKGLVDKLQQNEEHWYGGANRSKLVAEERQYTDAPVRELDWITWFECWVQIPEGDGTTALRRVATARNVLLDDQPATFVPIALGAAFPQHGRVQGVSLANKVIPVQVSKTEARRQYEDNLAASNNPKAMVWGINVEDAQAGRVDGLIRAESPNAIYQPVPVQDLSGGSLAYLDYMNSVRAEVGGAALDMQQPEQEALKSQIGAVATQAVLASQEQMSVFISRNLAETLVKQLYLMVHRLLREDWTGQLQVRQADQQQVVNPADWQARTEIVLTSGMSPSARNRKAANLMQIIQTQMGLLQSGLPLTDANGLHAALRDWALASDLGNVNSYLVDPDSQKGQQMAQAAQQQQQQQQQMQQQMAGVQLQLEQGKIAMDKYKADLSAQVDVFKANLQAEVDEAKLTLEGIQNAEKADIDRAQQAGKELGQTNGSTERQDPA